MSSTGTTPADRGESPSPEHPPIRLAGSVLGERRHICAFFSTREDEYRVTLPFIKDGFDCGDKAFHVIDPSRRADHLERLRSAGIDADSALQNARFELREWAETYLAYTRFDPVKHLSFGELMMQKARSEGFPLSRVIAHMEWVVEHDVDIDLLLEYEARTNYVWGGYPDPVICTYDLSRFRGDIVVDVMRTHPMVIVGGILQANPFYVEPDAFLQELRQRRGANGTRTEAD